MLLMCSFCFCKAQDQHFDHKIPAAGGSYKDFIPAGCDTLAMATGDLNKDGKDDIVLALYDTAENSNMDAARLLVILFRTDAGYMLKAKSDQLLLCKGCGGVFGDPFNGIDINKNVLTVNHYGGSAWRWSYISKYRYQNNDFYLIGKTDYSYWDVKNCDKYGEFAGTSFEETNFVTGDHVLKKISENCKLLADKKDKVKIRPLVKLVNYKMDN